MEKGVATHPNSCLDDPMNRGAWWAIVHGVAESDPTERLRIYVMKNIILEVCMVQASGNET